MMGRAMVAANGVKGTLSVVHGNVIASYNVVYADSTLFKFFHGIDTVLSAT